MKSNPSAAWEEVDGTSLEKYLKDANLIGHGAFGRGKETSWL